MFCQRLDSPKADAGMRFHMKVIVLGRVPKKYQWWDEEWEPAGMRYQSKPTEESRFGLVCSNLCEQCSSHPRVISIRDKEAVMLLFLPPLVIG